MKKRLSIAITIILIIITCLILYIVLNKQENKQNIESLSGLDVSSWKIYEDTECGITFKYPDDINSGGGQSRSATIKYTDEKSNPTYQAYAGYTYQYIRYDLSDKYYENLKKAQSEKGIAVEEFYHKNHKVVRFNSEGDKIKTYEFVSSEPTIYILGTSKDNCNYKFQNRGGQGFEILNAIVNSIEFTNKHCVNEGNYISTFPSVLGDDQLECCPGLKSVPPEDGVMDVNVCKNK